MTFLFSSPKDYFDELVRASAAGEFPAGDGVSCFYWTDDGRKCGIGKLWPDKICQEAERINWGGIDVYNETAKQRWKERLPEWLSAEDAKRIQLAHDGYVGEWDHDGFVMALSRIPVFAFARQTSEAS